MDGVPVLDKVADTLRAMWPDFPMPVTMTRPFDFIIMLTALTKFWLSVGINFSMPCAS